MYKEGISAEMCICIILGLTKNEVEAAEDILKFVQMDVFPDWHQHNMGRSMEASPSFSPR